MYDKLKAEPRNYEALYRPGVRGYRLGSINFYAGVILPIAVHEFGHATHHYMELRAKRGLLDPDPEEVFCLVLGELVRQYLVADNPNPTRLEELSIGCLNECFPI